MPISDFIDIPPTGSLRLRHARVPAALLERPLSSGIDAEGLIGADIEIADGRIAAIAAADSLPADGALDLNSGLVWPCFCDIHTHLDISHNWPRAPNLDGTVTGAIAAMEVGYRVDWGPDDLRRRMDFGLRCSYAHGSAAVRTHLNSHPPRTQDTWAAFRELRDRWAGRIDLQGTSLLFAEEILKPIGDEVADLAAESGGQLGCIIRWDGAAHAGMPDEIQATLDRLFEQAESRGLDLDLHVDEIGDAGARSLILIARTAIRRRFKGKILCGHCCSLSLQPDDFIEQTLTACSDAGIAVVSLPMCNLYLQGRAPQRTPRWRGVTLLHEMNAHGISVSLASDDIRNCWFAFGDHDMAEVFAQGVRIAHLDYPYGVWPAAVTAAPGLVMRLGDRGRFRVGAPADLVLFRARTINELISRSQGDRVVLRRGRPIDRTLPDYRELDDLQVPPRATA